MAGALATSRVTILLSTVIEPGTKSFVFRSSLASMSVMRRLCEAAPVTTLPSIRQLTAQLVWPVTTMSISSSMRLTTSTMAPVGLFGRSGGGALQLLMRSMRPPVPPWTAPPSWRRTTMASTPRCLRKGTSALTESASSLKSTEAMPVGETISRGALEGHARRTRS